MPFVLELVSLYGLRHDVCGSHELRGPVYYGDLSVVALFFCPEVSDVDVSGAFAGAAALVL